MTINPLEGIGPLRFGQTPAEIRSILGEPERVVNEFDTAVRWDFDKTKGISCYLHSERGLFSLSVAHNKEPLTFFGSDDILQNSVRRVLKDRNLQFKERLDSFGVLNLSIPELGLTFSYDEEPHHAAVHAEDGKTWVDVLADMRNRSSSSI